MPLAVLGVLILWFGWFGFNPGSTLGAVGARFADIAVTTNLAAGCRRARRDHRRLPARAHDRHRLRRQRRDRGPGRHHGALRLRRSVGRVRDRPRRRHPHGLDRRARWTASASTTRSARSPGTAWAASGARSRAASSRRPRWPSTNGVGEAGLFYGGGLHQLGVQALGIAAVFAFVFVASAAVFYACKKTIGLRVNAQQELEGLDIHEHGMWGYPGAVPARLRRDAALRPGSQPARRRRPAPRPSRPTRPSTVEGGD